MNAVRLTPGAAEKIRALLRRERRDGYAFRIKVVGGGCSGLQYQLMLDAQAQGLDQEWEEHGIVVRIDAKSSVYLVGSTVDYVDEIDESGFKINNPNATTTCGCGESFGA